MDLAEKLKNVEEELRGLSKEEKEKKVSEIIGSFSDDELDELRKQQCIFCMIAEGTVQSFVIYEDDLVKAVLDINPANKGHVLLFPRKHYAFTSLMDDNLTGHIFKIANLLGKAVFEAAKAQGTNIHVANGHAAGQTVQHATIHIIPRFENDGINISWDGKKIDDDEMKSIAAEIKSKVVVKKEKEAVKKEIKIENVPIGKRRIP